MDPMNISLIRVLTQTSQEKIDRHGRIIERAFPGLHVKSSCIQEQPKGIFDEASEEEALPKVMNLAKAMEADADALIISCAADPAVEQLKEMLCVPVVGAGESAAAVARVLGKDVGVITLSSEVPSSILKGLGNHFLSSQPVSALRSAADLGSHAIRHIFDAATQLKNKGSDVIVLGCTGFAALEVAPSLNRTLNMPVVDPLIAAGAIVYSQMLSEVK